jgi:hypothetical protein
MATPNFAFNLATVRGRKRNVILRALAQRQFMKALESGAFGQDQAHSLAKVIFG